MKIKVLAIIILLCLCFYFGFKKISNVKYETKKSDLGELKILNYLPKDNNLLFISNFDSSTIIKNLKNESNIQKKSEFLMLKNSIFDYLGLDLRKNKLEDIYNNELIIATYDNKNYVDDILIVFKIKPKKDLNDIFHLAYEIDQTDQITKIYRKNKLNYLKYIYRTKDNYVIASSDKQLILNSLNNKQNLEDFMTKYFQEVMLNFRNQNNILFRNHFDKNIFYEDKSFPNNNKDIYATTFKLEDKSLILESYLINKNKNLNIYSYENLINNVALNEDDYQVSIYSDLQNCINYLDPSIDNFEINLLLELAQLKNKNVLMLNSEKDWIIAFENNLENHSIISKLDIIKDFNKYSLEKNDHIYSIYSKNILQEEEETIKQFSFKNVYSFESEDIIVVSNNLVSEKNLELISDKFLDSRKNNYGKDFLYKKIELQNLNSNNMQFLSNFKDLNFLLQNWINISCEEFIEIVKQSIPENNPILFTKSKFRVLH